MLKYFYITNDPKVAVIAQNAGVDRIFIDMEYIGKELRQPKLDTVKNRHTVDDVRKIKSVLTSSELLVRVNPIYENSKNEIDSVIEAGADVVMLPMWTSCDDVKKFIEYVSGRAKTLLLLETDKAVMCLDDILKLDGIDEIHIGLNDMYLSQNKTFMFELLTDGTVDGIIEKIKAAGIPYGIGGVGSVGADVPLPAENILAEHYRLGSSAVILARAFCDTSKIKSYDEIRAVFESGIKANREFEKMLQSQSSEYFERIHEDTAKRIEAIKDRIKGN